MNIVTLSFYGKYGIIHYSAQLANTLAKDHNVTIFIPEYATSNYFDKKVRLIKISIPENYFSTLLNTFNYYLFKDLLKNIDQINPDVIHIIATHPWAFICLLFLHRKYPIISTIHEPTPRKREKILSIRPILALINKQLIKCSDKIIVHGEKLKKNILVKGIPNDKIEILPHGDFSFFTKYKKKYIEEKDTILFFGRINRYKGLEYLIKAEPIITKKFPKANIAIAGKGNFSKYKKLIENKNNFEILNEFIPDEKVAELFQRSKIVVLPYIEASQSGIIPIAYAFKKPVVVTNVGSIPEVVDDGKTGFIVPPRDVNALAGAIIKLLKDEKIRKEMGEKAYKKMKEELSWEKIAMKTIEVYKDAITSHRR